MSEIRLQKFLAESGSASRRKAEKLIKQGRVSVNGCIITEMGVRVSEEDLVELDGKAVSAEKRKVYIMLNKPVGYLCTVKDQFSRKTVIDLIPGVKERVYPVGRLDYNTSGLLLLTNDGDFSYRLTHPGHEIKKVYIADIIGMISDEDIKKFRIGIEIEDYVTSPADIRVVKKQADTTTVEIVIHEGRNRQVRKMCDEIGHTVVKLKRTAIGNLNLGDLKEGGWKYLDSSEIEEIKKGPM